MTDLGFHSWRWSTFRKAPLATFAASLALAVSGGCASQTSTAGVGGTGGADQQTTSSAASTGTGGAAITTTSSSSSSSSSGSGGMGGMEGTGGAATTTSTGSGGAGASSTGTGGMGTGGAGGSWVPPMGTAIYPAEMEQNNLKSTANPMAAGTEGFTASMYPAGDVDNFSFTITTGGSSVTIATGDGMGGCPIGAKTYVRVVSDTSAVLGIDTDSGPADCSLLKPATHPNLASLAAGTYFVHVESADIHAIPFYILSVKISQPGCADGIVQFAAGEQCDDGNTAPGDGCSPTCQLEGGYLSETEPNDTQDLGNSLTGFVGAVGQIMPAGDQDYYTFDVTVPGSTLVAEVGDGFTGCPTGMDSKLTLYSPTKVVLATDDDGGVGVCSMISPALYPAATNLAVGKYGLKVERLSNMTVVPFYALKVKVTPPGCGDGFLQTGEQCDDGNTAAGDGCSPTCQFEKTYAAEVEVNDTQGLANSLPAGLDGFIGSIMPAGDLDYYNFNAPPGASVTITVSDGLSGCPSFDSKLTLYDPAHVQIAMDDDGGVAPCSKISPATYAAAGNLAGGLYTVRVERTGNNGTQLQYVVTIAVKPAGCGDSILQAGEQCDDGNATAGDGCSATCQAEAPWEVEPNGSIMTATPQWPGVSRWKGRIAQIGDHDYFTFTLAAPGGVTLETHDVDDPAACGFDTNMHLLDSTGTQIVEDDDDGVGSCSKISPGLNPQVANLPAGTYYVWVQRYNDTMTIPQYQLDLTIQ